MSPVKELAALYAGSFIAQFIIAFRLGYRLYLRQKFGVADWLAGIATFPLLFRVALNHIILLYGTNNIDTEELMRLSEVDIRHREIGSKFDVVVRVCYVTYLWMMKGCLMFFYQRMVSNLPVYDLTVKLIWAFLVASYIAIILASLLECRPIYLYWQVVPSPGVCKNPIKTLLLGILNIITDAILVVFPLPIVFRMGGTMAKKFNISLLFCVGMLVITVTIVRLPKNYHHVGSTAGKIFWCSLEIAAATLAANGCVIYSMVRKPKTKDQDGS